MSDPGLRATPPGPSIAVTVPTMGRPSLAYLLSELARQTRTGDRVIVVCDRPPRHAWCSLIIEGLRRGGVEGRWTVWGRENLGHFGHVARNEALDFLHSLEHRPDWVWSIDDDDLALPGALDAIRVAAASEEGPWYLFATEGGAGSHFQGVTVPNPGLGVRIGNIPTPAILVPVDAKARWGLSNIETFGGLRGAGYFGDGQYGVALEKELGAPMWCSELVAVIRPGLEMLGEARRG